MPLPCAHFSCLDITNHYSDANFGVQDTNANIPAIRVHPYIQLLSKRSSFVSESLAAEQEVSDCLFRAEAAAKRDRLGVAERSLHLAVCKSGQTFSTGIIGLINLVSTYHIYSVGL